MDLARASVNQYTVKPLSLLAAIDVCLRHGIPAIAPWRDKVEELGLQRAARALRQSGLRVSSLCRGGFFPAATGEQRANAIDENKRAITEAAELGTKVLVIVCGSAVRGVSLSDARMMVAEGIAALMPFAEAHGVRLAIEPLHPMMIAERSVIVSLGEAIDLAASFASPFAGVIVDVYHVFWDHRVHQEIARAGERIFGFHLSDWRTPAGDITADRAMLGDGIIDLKGLAGSVAQAGFCGDIEIEVLSERLWREDPDTLLRTALSRYAEIDPPADPARYRPVNAI